MKWIDSLCHKIFVILPPLVLILSFSINQVQSSVLFTFLHLPLLNMILHSFGLLSRDLRPSSSPGTPLWRCAVTGRWRRRWTSPDSWKWDTWMWPTRLTCKHSDVSHVTDRSFCMSVLLSRESFIDFLFSVSTVELLSTMTRLSIASPHAMKNHSRASRGSSTPLPPLMTLWSARYSKAHSHTITSVVTACAWQSYICICSVISGNANLFCS